MDFLEVRRIAITALFSDDLLFDSVVLKGGNAITIVYGLGSRTSLDIDFSMEGEFEDEQGVADRINRALRDRFDARGLVVFDFVFAKRPEHAQDLNPKWGGYRAEFKLIDKKLYQELRLDEEALRRNATVVGPAQKRIFAIDISKREVCEGKTEAELDGFVIYVYTPEMIAIEKLRAICQQMPEYAIRVTKTPRARDFYDIWVLVTQAAVCLDTGENSDLLAAMFAAKDVDLKLLQLIHKYREFHRPDWAAVELAIAERLESFDFYFDFVLREVAKLEMTWNI